MKPRVLFLDDNEERIRGFLLRVPFDVEVIIVRDADTAIEAIEHMRINVAFLDHDLGGKVNVATDPYGNTGSCVVRHLVAYGFKYPWLKRIILHSLNEPARTSMRESLTAQGSWEVWDAPFTAWDWDRLNSAWKNLD